MHHVHFDPVDGASGELILGSLLDAGLPLATVTTSLSMLQLGGYGMSAEQTVRHGVPGTVMRLEIASEAATPDWESLHRHLASSGLPDTVREATGAILDRVVAVEQPGSELSATDRLRLALESCAVCIGLHALNVGMVTCAPLPAGSGAVADGDSIRPTPHPIATALISEQQVPLVAGADARSTADETLTVAATAILTTLCQFEHPAMQPHAVGYGLGPAGSLRAWLSAVDETELEPSDMEIEATVTTMPQGELTLALSRLRDAGATDVTSTHVTQADGADGVRITALGPASQRDAIAHALVVETSATRISERDFRQHEVLTEMHEVNGRWGAMPIRLRIWAGRVLDATPDEAGCVAIAREHEVPYRDVWSEAIRMSAAFVGQRR